MASKHALCAAVLLAAAGQASADGSIYAGGKIGLMDLDFRNTDEATNLGVLLGYDFAGTSAIRGAIELELTTTIFDGDIDGAGDWDLDTQAAYGVIKIGDALYAKLKGGVLHEEGSVNGHSGSDTELSVGLGGGWRLAPNVALEAEYTRIEDDVDFWSFGANFYF